MGVLMALSNIILDKRTTKRGADPDYSSVKKYCYFLDGETETLKNILILDVDVHQESKIMTSPTESGAILSDHRIFMPTEIIVKCTLPIENWKDVYDQLVSWYTQTETNFLTIVTKADSYTNMQLIALPHKETAESVSRLFFDLKFREVKIVEPEYVTMTVDVVEKKSDAAKVDAGQKRTKSLFIQIEEKKQDLARAMVNFFIGK